MKSAAARPALPDRKDVLIALGIGLCSLFLYVRTLLPGLLPGDSGEFQALAYTIGHAHTPGYEVQVLFLRLFTLLVPIGDIAYRINLLSAAAGAVTVALMYIIGRVLSGSRWAGLVSAFALSITATFWSQSIIAEVYTPGAVFASAILLLVLLWDSTRRGRFLFIAGLLGGLAIGVHSTNGLFAPAIILLILLGWRDLRRSLLPALGGALLGAALMLAAFVIVDASPAHTSTIRSIYQPSISRWDQQSQDLDTISGRFAFLAFAKQWRSAMYSGDPQTVTNNSRTFGAFFARDYVLLLRLLMLVGLISLFARRWQLGLFFLTALLVHLDYTLNYRIGDIYVFFISLYVYLSPLLAEGLAVCLRALGRLPGNFPKIAQPALALVVLLLTVLPVYPQRLQALQQGEMRYDFMNLMSNRQLQGWHALLSDQVKQLPPNAVVLTDWEKLYGYYYVANVEQNRSDLTFLETYPYSTKQGLADSMILYLKGQLQNDHPVYTERDIAELTGAGLSSKTIFVGTWRMYAVTNDR